MIDSWGFERVAVAGFAGCLPSIHVLLCSVLTKALFGSGICQFPIQNVTQGKLTPPPAAGVGLIGQRIIPPLSSDWFCRGHVTPLWWLRQWARVRHVREDLLAPNKVSQERRVFPFPLDAPPWTLATILLSGWGMKATWKGGRVARGWWWMW